MNKVLLNVKTDAHIKEEASKIAKEMGIPLSTVVNAYLRQFIDEQEVTISNKKTYRMTPEFETSLDEIEEDIKHGRNADGPFSTPEEVQDYLDSLKTA